jgi:hypothetical protein
LAALLREKMSGERSVAVFAMLARRLPLAVPNRLRLLEIILRSLRREIDWTTPLRNDAIMNDMNRSAAACPSMYSRGLALVRQLSEALPGHFFAPDWTTDSRVFVNCECQLEEFVCFLGSCLAECGITVVERVYRGSELAERLPWEAALKLAETYERTRPNGRDRT